jgi:hypothetical protein
MLHSKSYLIDALQTVAPFLRRGQCSDQQTSIHTIASFMLFLGYFILIGEEHLEPSLMDEICKSISLEDRLFLKACLLEAYRTSTLESSEISLLSFFLLFVSTLSLAVELSRSWESADVREDLRTKRATFIGSCGLSWPKGHPLSSRDTVGDAITTHILQKMWATESRSV